MTSYAYAIRIGWINDGIIRDCVFSNIVMANCNGGIGINLPKGGETRLSDQGEDATLIERLSFDNIIIDRNYHEPISVKIDENNLVDAIRDISFSNIRSVSGLMPSFYGRDDARLENILLSNCTFTIEQVEEHIAMPPGIPCYIKDEVKSEPLFKNVKRLNLNNVIFNV